MSKQSFFIRIHTSWRRPAVLVLALSIGLLIGRLNQMLDSLWQGALVVLLVLLSLILGSLTTAVLVMWYAQNQTYRYRLAWLSARRRALRNRLLYIDHRSPN